MKLCFRLMITTYFLVSWPGLLLAEAPVVDSNENFALLEQQTAHKPSVASRDDQYGDDMGPALAHESPSDTSSGRDSADLINTIQGLRQEIQELRGQLEIQAHDLKALQEQQLSFYNDLDARISGRPATKYGQKQSAPLDLDASPAPMQHVDANTNTKDAVAVSGASSPDVAPTVVVANETNRNPADEQISYLKAYELVKTKQYDDALASMQLFTQKYPKGGYAANAEYWLGELYLVKHNYAEAINHFSKVLQEYPSSSKYSASLLKIGYALADDGRVIEAKARLREVLKKYPDTTTANLARMKLETLGG